MRGMHYQAVPHVEDKLISCTNGSIHDVIVDLRVDSSTYCRWFAVELSAESCRLLYVPKGFAHGFQTLEDHTVVFYQISEFHHPESARGARWDDPAFGIAWPLPVSCISGKDAGFPLLDKASAPFAPL